jgi:chemotaxis methyl-accepting protein methylase
MAAEYLEPWADAAGPRYRVREAVRARVVFSRHDITRDCGLPGGAAFDLVAFRNVAIYFKRDVQERAFARVVHALLPGGCLCLGEAEWPPAALASRLHCSGRRLRVFRVRCDMEAAA